MLARCRLNKQCLASDYVLSIMDSPKNECYYFLLDVVPISIVFALGIFISILYISCSITEKCKTSSTSNLQQCECISKTNSDSWNCNAPCSCLKCKCWPCSCRECREKKCSCVSKTKTIPMSECDCKTCNCSEVCKCDVCQDKHCPCSSVDTSKEECSCYICHNKCGLLFCIHCGKIKIKCTCEERKCKCYKSVCECVKAVVCLCCKKSKQTVLWLVSELVKLIYGDEFYLIKEQPESDEVDESGRIKMYVGKRPIKSSALCLHTFLGVKSILVVSLLAMVFLDVLVVRSFPGCQQGFDCYYEDNNYAETPLNCSDLLNDTKVICYSIELSTQTAFSAVGGILIISRLVIVLSTKIIVSCTSNCNKKPPYKWCCCYKRRSPYKCNCCCCHCSWNILIQVIQIICGIIFGVTYGVTVWKIFQEAHERPTDLKKAGYGMQYATVGLAILLTIIAPWYQLVDVKHNCEEYEMLEDSTS